MWELFSSGLIGVWLNMAGIKPSEVNLQELLTWQGVPLIAFPAESDKKAKTTINQYLKQLAAQGRVIPEQGIWMQSGVTSLFDHQGAIPRPAASLTKVATTLAALETWGPQHRFETLISAKGIVKNGVLQGDLLVDGNGDPFFVWEESVALAHTLNQIGIRQVTGNLIVSGKFYMNYQFNPLTAGQLLRQGLNGQNVPASAFKLPPGSPSPQVAIAGTVQVGSVPESTRTLLIRHQSMSLAQILKQMNIYSNNEMAEMLAKSLGGGSIVARLASQGAGVPQIEISLVNGSGLGIENKISPRAVVAMFGKIQRYLQPHNLTVADIFPVSGYDRQGTLLTRRIPAHTVVKTGTLNDVSALAGAIPTRDRGLVWFAIINRGVGFENFRTQQDRLLQSLIKIWGVASHPPAIITPTGDRTNPAEKLGDLARNQVVGDRQARVQK
ncbi:D-alanyl-D-alanine carboxypeptidase [Merismopedia glauca]|uniref:D-alanyl-D-alanine carboxypeptidase n=1 Tax=Merismopedia glauca CCAP 1448/3 TaxID=1296344 RepID=A0A2T1CA98_9CYAN|nr:D-alanyl-D-alanine carboxypeptidase [Merismopedia glauca]PSB05159.1 D-alanyl-D-alanine carboxypeptidase [Merismopedia glauca CCAP 1448/3]